MAENTTPAGEQGQQDPANKGGNEGGQQGEPKKPEGNEGEPKTLTPDEVNKIVSERLSKEQKKHSEELKKAREDWERQSKLSEEEREKELRAKQAKEIADRERELTLRENRADGREKLTELGIPQEFVDFVLDEDADKMGTKIQTLHKSWTDAVAQEVKNQLKGETPKAPSNNNSGSDQLVTTI